MRICLKKFHCFISLELVRGNVYCSRDMGSNYSDVEMSREEPETSHKCMVTGSLEEPLLIESTTLLLSHLNSTL